MEGSLTCTCIPSLNSRLYIAYPSSRWFKTLMPITCTSHPCTYPKTMPTGLSGLHTTAPIASKAFPKDQTIWFPDYYTPILVCKAMPTELTKDKTLWSPDNYALPLYARIELTEDQTVWSPDNCTTPLSCLRTSHHTVSVQLEIIIHYFFKRIQMVGLACNCRCNVPQIIKQYIVFFGVCNFAYI